jgi:hypothetical protein
VVREAEGSSIRTNRSLPLRLVSQHRSASRGAMRGHQYGSLTRHQRGSCRQNSSQFGEPTGRRGERRADGHRRHCTHQDYRSAPVRLAAGSPAGTMLRAIVMLKGFRSVERQKQLDISERQLNLLKKKRRVTRTQNRAPADRRRVGAHTKALGNPNGEGTGGQERAGGAAPAHPAT